MLQASYLFHKQENVGRYSAASLSWSEKNLPNPAAPRHFKQTEKTGIIITNAPHFNVTTHEWLSPPNPATFSDDTSVYLRDLISPSHSHCNALTVFPALWDGSRNHDYFRNGQHCSSYFPLVFCNNSAVVEFLDLFYEAFQLPVTGQWVSVCCCGRRLWKRLVTVCCVALPPMWLRAEPWLETFLFRHVKVKPRGMETWAVRWCMRNVGTCSIALHLPADKLTKLTFC